MNKPPRGQHGKDAGRQHTGHPSNLGLSEGRDAKDESGQTQRPRQRKNRIRNWFWMRVGRHVSTQRVNVAIGFALALITGFYTYYAKKQVAHMQETIDLTKANTRRSERAYLYWGEATLKTPLVVNAPIQVQTSLRNSGVTPALDVRLGWRFDFPREHDTPIWRQLEIPLNYPAVIDIAASLTTPVVVTRGNDGNRQMQPLTSQEAADLASEATQMEVYVSAAYRDVFDDTDAGATSVPDVATAQYRYVLTKRGDLTSGRFDPVPGNYHIDPPVGTVPQPGKPPQGGE